MAFEARNSRWRMAGLALVSLMFVGFSVILVVVRPETMGIKGLVGGWLGIAFFGPLTLVMVPRLFHSGPEIRIDGNGIYYRRRSPMTIPWGAIDKLQLGEVRVGRSQRGDGRFLNLYLSDPRAFPAVGLARLAVANKLLGFSEIALTTGGTDRSFDELVAAVATFAPPRLVAPPTAPLQVPLVF